MDVSSAQEDEILERMLKEAEDLAFKMKKTRTDQLSSIKEAGQDPVTPVDAMGREYQKNDGNNSSLQLDRKCLQNDEFKEEEHEESLADEGDIDDILRQCEALLGRISPKMLESSSECPALAGKKCIAEAASSVYVLEQNTTHDDVSSVGSSSLRASRFSSKGASIQLSGLGDESTIVNVKQKASPIASSKGSEPGSGNYARPENLSGEVESQLIMKKPQTKPQDGTVTLANKRWEKDTFAQLGNDDYVPILDFESQNQATTLAKPIDAPHEVDQTQAIMTQVHSNIADSTRTQQNKDWEKVTSAQMGDNDYVPILDFSSQNHAGTHAKPKDAPHEVDQSKLIVKNAPTKIPDFTRTQPNAKWEKVTSAQLGDDDYVPIVDYFPSKPPERQVGSDARQCQTSRRGVHSVQKNLKRRRRKRVLLAFMLTIIAALFYYLIGTQIKTRKNSRDLPDERMSNTPTPHYNCDSQQSGSFDNCGTLDSLENLTDGTFSYRATATQMEKAMFKAEQHSTLGGIHTLDERQFPGQSVGSQEKGPLTVEIQELSSGISNGEPSVEGSNPSCKHIHNRIFRKKCREMARERKGKM